MEKPKSTPAILKQAHWIWPDNPHWDLRNCYALFRKQFKLKTFPKHAPVYLTADQSYQLYINGHYICCGPARGFQSSWPYDQVDVAQWLQLGQNTIAIRAHTPGHSNFQYIHQGFAGLLFAAKWGSTILLSDSSWRCRRQSGIRTDTECTSLQLFPQEHIDLRIEDPDWVSANFDDSVWDSEAVPRPWNSLPWYRLSVRGIPMLDERIVFPIEAIGQATGQSEADYLHSRNLAVTRFKEGLAHNATRPASGELSFAKTPKGHWRSLLIDFGKTQVGRIRLDIRGASEGVIVETHHYETIDNETLCPDYQPKAHSRMAFSQRLTCRKGNNTHEFYHAFGFRYMVLTVRDNPSPIRIRTSLRTAVYPMQRKGSFTSSDDTLNRIWETCAWTQQVCSMDAYVDTPWREQAQWWGDARVQSWNTFHLSGETRLLKRGIDQIAAQTTPEGVTYGHAPSMAHNCILPDFTLIWILTIWDYYWQTGSLNPFQKHRPVIDKALDYFEHSIHPKTGLLEDDDRFWLFLDWTGLHKQGCSSVYSLWYLHALDRVSEMCLLDGDTSKADLYKKKAKQLRKNLRKLINQEGLLQDGFDQSGRVVKETSIHAQTLAILTKLSPRSEKKMLELRLLPLIRGTLQSKIQPSAYWITYIYTTLAERGYGNEVITDIRDRWSPMVTHGTTWENFAPKKGDESFSHAWSAHPLFHLMQILSGIRQDAPKWHTIVIEPHFIGDSANIAIPTPLGKIYSHWERQSDRIVGKIELPKNMMGILKLPELEATSVYGIHTYSCYAAPYI